MSPSIFLDSTDHDMPESLVSGGIFPDIESAILSMVAWIVTTVKLPTLFTMQSSEPSSL
jgi:hypothetical protein